MKGKTDIMGIVNLTDNSFYAASRRLGADGTADADAVLREASRMVAEGATILDIGACSSRPGSLPVDEETEWNRLRDILPRIREAFPDLPLSIDTFRSGIVERAFDRIGPFTVNDISAGEDDPAMLPLAGRLSLGYIAMHKRGTPADMQTRTDYAPTRPGEALSPVTAAVKQYFEAFARKAEDCGVSDWILDPGFGFAKTLQQNYDLLRELGALRIPGHRILVGVSRKSMIYKLSGITPEESLPGTQVLHLAALQQGAEILRVHDVAEAVRTVRIWEQLRGQNPS